MVGNEELSPVSAFAQHVAQKVRGLTAENGLTQMHVATRLGRAQSYVSNRMQGRQAWTTNDLDAIAGMMGMTGMQLLEEVSRRSRDRR
jgi:transcriptional regulator with XRE-family HTH domain